MGSWITLQLKPFLTATTLIHICANIKEQAVPLVSTAVHQRIMRRVSYSRLYPAVNNLKYERHKHVQYKFNYAGGWGIVGYALKKNESWKNRRKGTRRQWLLNPLSLMRTGDIWKRSNNRTSPWSNANVVPGWYLWYHKVHLRLACCSNDL